MAANYPQRVQRTLVIYSSTCRKAEHVEQLLAVLTVQRNYHIQLSEDKHYYSVPYQYVGKMWRCIITIEKWRYIVIMNE
jgi:hypothetical protein